MQTLGKSLFASTGLERLTRTLEKVWDMMWRADQVSLTIYKSDQGLLLDTFEAQIEQRQERE